MPFEWPTVTLINRAQDPPYADIAERTEALIRGLIDVCEEDGLDPEVCALALYAAGSAIDAALGTPPTERLARFVVVLSGLGQDLRQGAGEA